MKRVALSRISKHIMCEYFDSLSRFLPYKCLRQFITCLIIKLKIRNPFRNVFTGEQSVKVWEFVSLIIDVVLAQ